MPPGSSASFPHHITTAYRIHTDSSHTIHTPRSILPQRIPTASPLQHSPPAPPDQYFQTGFSTPPFPTSLQSGFSTPPCSSTLNPLRISTNLPLNTHRQALQASFPHPFHFHTAQPLAPFTHHLPGTLILHSARNPLFHPGLIHTAFSVPLPHRPEYAE